MAKRTVNGSEIGERISQARREAGGMKQRELADLLQVTERSIAAYEAGDVIPYRFMADLEKIFRRPTSWFLYGDHASSRGGGIEATLEEIVDRLERIERAISPDHEPAAALDAEELRALAELAAQVRLAGLEEPSQDPRSEAI